MKRMNSKVVVRFTNSIYDMEAIQKAVNDYKNICDVEVSFPESDEKARNECSHIICTFSNSKADMQLTIKEFCNYVIEQMNVRRT